jgi:hypothetical protein
VQINLWLSQKDLEIAAFCARCRPFSDTNAEQCYFQAANVAKRRNKHQSPRGVSQMSDVMQKARQGRIAALNAMGMNNRENPMELTFGRRSKSRNHQENVVFISNRANRSSVLMLG